MIWQYLRVPPKKKIHPTNLSHPKNGLYIPPKSAESSFSVKNACFLFDCMDGNTYNFYLFFVQIYYPGSRDLTNRHFQEFLFNFNTIRGL